MSAISTGFQTSAPEKGPAVDVPSERGALGTVYKLFTGKELNQIEKDLPVIDTSKLKHLSKYGTFNLYVGSSVIKIK